MSIDWPANTVAGILKVRRLSTTSPRAARFCSLVYDWEPVPAFRHHAINLPHKPRVPGRYALLKRTCECWVWVAIGLAPESLDRHP